MAFRIWAEVCETNLTQIMDSIFFIDKLIE
jgi:hypothetical protein